MGLSQTDLAAKVGVTQSSIADYEKGRSKPKFKTTHDISQTLGLPFEDIAGEQVSTMVHEYLYEKSTIDYRMAAIEFWPDGEFTDSGANDKEFSYFLSCVLRLFLNEKIDDKTLVSISHLLRTQWRIALAPEMTGTLHDRITLIVRSTASFLEAEAAARKIVEAELEPDT